MGIPDLFRVNSFLVKTARISGSIRRLNIVLKPVLENDLFDIFTGISPLESRAAAAPDSFSASIIPLDLWPLLETAVYLNCLATDLLQDSLIGKILVVEHEVVIMRYPYNLVYRGNTGFDLDQSVSTKRYQPFFNGLAPQFDMGRFFIGQLPQFGADYQ
jgi:hypothetical protein